jgi:hypothetical protein
MGRADHRAQHSPIEVSADTAASVQRTRRKTASEDFRDNELGPAMNRSNQTLERTADRRENLLSTTSIVKPEAQLAVVSGRSACSR